MRRPPRPRTCPAPPANRSTRPPISPASRQAAPGTCWPTCPASASAAKTRSGAWARGHYSGRGAGGGPAGSFGPSGAVAENRTVLIHNEIDNARIAGTLKWNGPASLVANLNGNYTLNYGHQSNDEERDLVVGVD